MLGVGAFLLMALILRVGFGALRSLGTSIPPPPPPGEMRKVKLRYRCSLCGTEVRKSSSTLIRPRLSASSPVRSIPRLSVAPWRPTA